ncbi:manganese/iron ABC transporter ATP-binding protein [Micavibrio aeruginosavorus]|uniref:ABC transporter family protein n=1 Tax=Micavibrio aeruginosavorus (strain ARL-13) TaxID=856793 RepID=G2KPY4_MICAA|nr:manganese/iron ABC transporter ATP-binding protein [Micavibrio aeruginosavorus]AEP10352.1 ABC transporter family protein [Micavibrio aeruginosavorus ARL-13]
MNDATIHLHNVGVTYPNGHSALHDVNVTLHSGVICGLVGVNGAGKSTLFKTMMGFITPTTGTVTIAGQSVKQALRRNMVAYVPQTEEVDWNFPVLVEDVVMMGRYGHMGFLRTPKQPDRDAVDSALKRVGMFDYKKRQIGELSGGQKKRIFVARALAQGGSIILLDEPFTGVDIKTEASLIELFRSLAAEGRMILVSTHNLGSVPSFCDEVILINRTVVAYGPVETTFTEANLTKVFGGMLRHLQLAGRDLHDDEDSRCVTVLTDDERPLVLYGEQGGERIVKTGRDKP